MQSEKACRKCHAIVRGRKCPMCGSTDLTINWSGRVIILDPEKSEVAKKLNIDRVGEYALKVI